MTRVNCLHVNQGVVIFILNYGILRLPDVHVNAHLFIVQRFERTMFDVRVFNPFVPSNRNLTLPSVYRKHEQEKRRKYERRVLEVEHSSFVPIVFSTTGGEGKASSALFARIASKLSDKRNEPFSVTMAFVRTKLSFSLVRAMVASLRGYRRS